MAQSTAQSSCRVPPVYVRPLPRLETRTGKGSHSKSHPLSSGRPAGFYCIGWWLAENQGGWTGLLLSSRLIVASFMLSWAMTEALRPISVETPLLSIDSGLIPDQAQLVLSKPSSRLFTVVFCRLSSAVMDSPLASPDASIEIPTRNAREQAYCSSW